MDLAEAIEEYQMYMPRSMIEVNNRMVYITIMKYPVSTYTLTKELDINTIQDTIEYTIDEFIKFMEGV